MLFRVSGTMRHLLRLPVENFRQPLVRDLETEDRVFRAFMRDLRMQGAVINFEVYADPDLNSASQLAQGKVYWNIRFTDVPPAENPNFRVEVTNQWLTEVLDNAKLRYRELRSATGW